MDVCDNPNCEGAATCRRGAGAMVRYSDGSWGGFPCEWDFLLLPIITLADDPERIANGELMEYLSAYYDDLEYLA